MQVVCALINVSIIIFELYLEATADFAFQQLFFDAGEIVLPHFSYCIFIFSMYVNFLWRHGRFISDRTMYASIIYALIVWMAGHFLLKPMWILLLSCSATVIQWIGNAFGQTYTIASGSKRQLYLTYVSLALAVMVSCLVFPKTTKLDLDIVPNVSTELNFVPAPDSVPVSVSVQRKSKIFKYRIPKYLNTNFI